MKHIVYTFTFTEKQYYLLSFPQEIGIWETRHHELSQLGYTFLWRHLFSEDLVKSLLQECINIVDTKKKPIVVLGTYHKQRLLGYVHTDGLTLVTENGKKRYVQEKTPGYYIKQIDPGLGFSTNFLYLVTK